MHPNAQSLPALGKPRGLTCSDGLAAVEREMTRLVVGTRLERAGAMAQEHLGSGGRRIRARLALSAAEALGLPRSAAVGWATAVELLHNASLVHDDIQDGDRVRRNRPTLWARHGVGQAINAGDLMLVLCHSAVESLDVDDGLKWRLSALLARHAAETVRGQSKEMALLSSGHLDVESYREAIASKTAALFALPVEGAALLAGLSPEQARCLGAAFEAPGMLFQLQDDVMDLYGDKGRGFAGSDIYEGKVSILVVRHLERCPEDRASLTELLALPREETPASAVQDIIRRFRESGALAAALNDIDQLLNTVDSSPVLAQEPGLRWVAQELTSLAAGRLRASVEGH